MATIATKNSLSAAQLGAGDRSGALSASPQSIASAEQVAPGVTNIALGVLLVGSVAIAIPTMVFVARESWGSDEGAHGPIVLATGLWLLWQLARGTKNLIAPPPAWRVALLFGALLPLYIVSRITQVVELEGYLMYANLLVTLYGVVGGKLMQRLWFPLFYLAFIFPPPESLVAMATIPMKAGISQASVSLLGVLGYPIGSAGVTIYIGQYQLLVAAACSGLNSIVSLSAISLFYIYLRHQAEWRYGLFLVLLIVPIALLANLVRVLILILLTYHAGEATASGFLHNSAGLVTFAAALLAIFAIDSLLKPLWNRFVAKKADSRSAEMME